MNASSANPVLLSLGGNLGDPGRTFLLALQVLSKHGFRILKRSDVYRNPAQGCEEGAPEFLNLAVLGEWDSSPLELLELCQKTEVQFGRPADHPYHVSRNLDIDIIQMGNLILQTDRLTLPHPRAAERDFVVIPAARIAPELVLTGSGKTFSALLKHFSH